MGTDASDHGIAAVLYQEYEDRPHYFKFSARALRGVEAKSYGATKRELLAVIFALQEFRPWLWGKQFKLRTDHSSLTYLFTQKSANQMIQNWFEILIDYDFEIEHMPGILNVLPDRLSRIYNQGLRKSRIGFKAVKEVEYNATEDFELVDLQVINDGSVRESKLVEAHLKGHFGAKAIELAIKNDGFTWKNIRLDAQKTVSKCLQCQRYNIGQRGFHPTTNLKASLTFDHFCLDVKNMSLTSRGDKAYLLIIDIFTRFVFLKALQEQSAISVARALFEICCTVGFPRIEEAIMAASLSTRSCKS